MTTSTVNSCKLPDAEKHLPVNNKPFLSTGEVCPCNMFCRLPTLPNSGAYLPQIYGEGQYRSYLVISEMNLKFTSQNCPSTLTEKRPKDLGVSVSDVAQTMQLAFAGQRFGYFNTNGRQYSVLGQFERSERNEAHRPHNPVCKNNRGELVQLDNIAKAEEESSPPQLYTTTSL